MSKLATLAFSTVRKPTKKRVMEIIETMADGVVDHDELKVLAELYSYFKPPVPATPKTPADWVCKAMAKNDVRFYLNRLEVSDGKLVATDGSRLHICDTTLADGAYDTQFNTLDDAGKFPDLKRVITRHKQLTSFENVKVIQHLTSTPGKERAIKGNFVDVEINDVVIRFGSKYWNDAISIFDGSAFVYYATKNDGILIEQNGNQAVLMPVLTN